MKKQHLKRKVNRVWQLIIDLDAILPGNGNPVVIAEKINEILEVLADDTRVKK